MEEKKRIVWLDELRGLLVIGMVFHHFCYTLGYLFDVEVGRRIFVGFGPLHPLGAGLFILICGFCCHLSHSNVRRGLLLLGAATAMSLFLWIFMPENRIWFGILQLLAVCILLYAAGSRALAHVPLWCGVAVCAVLLVLTWHLPPEEAGRWINVSWGSNTRESYRTTLEVVAKDRLNLIVDISTVLSSTKTHVSSLNARSTPDGFALITLDTDVSDSQQLQTVMRRIEQISGVMRVTRPAG